MTVRLGYVWFDLPEVSCVRFHSREEVEPPPPKGGGGFLLYSKADQCSLHALNLMHMSPSDMASLLGRLAKGKPKNITKAERKRRAARLAEARKKRWS